MKKTVMLCAAIFSIAALHASDAEQPVNEQPRFAMAKGQPVTGMIQQINALMPFVKGAHEFGKVFLDLFGLKKMAEGMDDLINASLAFAKEAEKQNPNYEALETAFIAMQAATEPILEDMKKVFTVTTKPLQWFSPMVTGPLKLVGKKTVKKTVEQKDPITEIVTKTTIEIPIDEVVKQLPEMLTQNIFKLIQAYNSIIGKILKKMQETRKKIKTTIEEETSKQLPEKSMFQKSAPEKLPEYEPIITPTPIR